MYALLVDLSGALKYGPDAPVSIARVLLGERRDFHDQFVTGSWSLLVVKRCAVQLGKFTSPKNRASVVHQVVNNPTSFSNRQLFFAR